ncbi:MAG TPA: sugar transferase [Anaerolineales bacterium]|nr:sugar transferase [Anaerolineales bacterium]
MKRLQQWVWPVLDAALIWVASALAWYLRYEVQLFRAVDPAFLNPVTEYFGLFAGITAIFLAVLAANGGYTARRGSSLISEIARVTNAALISIVIIVAITFGFRPFAFSRLLFFYDGVLIVFLLGAARAIRRQVEARLRQIGIGVERVLIVGAGEVGRAVMRTMVARPDLGYFVVGFVDDDPVRGSTDVGRFHALGGLDGVEAIIKKEKVDEIIITIPWMYHRRIAALVAVCERRAVRPRVVPELFQFSLSRVDVDDLGGIPLIGVKEHTLPTTARLVKRTMDVVFAALALAVLWPVFLIVAMAIKLESRGPALFAQSRVGQNGKLFKAYKFRSMYQDAEEQLTNLSERNEASGPLFKIKDDPRRTRVGRLLRRTSLDEFPQLINVLKGEMSWVGPRPALPQEVEQYEPWQRQRLDVSQGITGLPQVSGRSDLTFDEMCLLDIYYIENWSLSLDLTILLRTIPQVLLGRGAY